MKLTASLKTVALAGSALSAVLPLTAYGQTVEQVVVTGSYIRGVAPVGSSVISVDAEDMKTAGVATAVDLLHSIPLVTNLGFDTSTPAAGRSTQGNLGNSTFARSINLRGIGSADTLTLINGTRLAPGQGGNVTDIDDIPSNLLQRIDVVADGGSATYGSDAVAGTVNLIYRQPTDIVQSSVRFGHAKGMDDWQFGQLIGTTWNAAATGLGDGGVIIAYQHTHNSHLDASAHPEIFTDDLRPYIGAVGAPSTFASPANVSGFTGAGGTSAIYAGPTGVLYNQGITLAQLGTVNVPRYGSEWDKAVPLPSITRDSGGGNFKQDITDWLTFFANGYYERRHAAATVSDGNGAIRGFDQTLSVPNTNPFSPCATAAAASSAGLPPPSATNSQGITCPANGTISVLYKWVNELSTPQRVSNEISWQAVGGFDVKLPYDWHAKLFADRSTDWSLTTSRGINPFALAQVLSGVNKPAGVPFFNPFCDNTNGPCNPKVTDDYFGSTTTWGAGQGASNKIFEANATFDGPILQLPGGEARLAIGGDYYWFSASTDNPSSVSDAIGVVTHVKTHAERIVRAAYAELFLPLVGPHTGIPAIQKLELTVAGRYTKYGDGPSTSNPKIGINWTPIDDIKIHGSYGTSFRAPSLNDVHGVGTLFTTNTLPCSTLVGCVGTATLSATQAGGGNANIQPETSKTRSLGADWSPASIPGLTATVNYFDISIQKLIGQVVRDAGFTTNANNPVYAPFTAFNPAFFPSRAFVTPFVQTLLPAQNLVLGAPLTTAQFNAAYNALYADPFYSHANINSSNPPAYFSDGRRGNSGSTSLNGLDFTANYTFETDWGVASLGGSANYNLSYRTEAVTGAGLQEVLNNLQYPMRFRGRLQAGLESGPWSGMVYFNYVNPYHAPPSTLIAGAPVRFQSIDSFKTFDVTLSYTTSQESSVALLRNAQIVLSATNVFDTPPPFVLTQTTGPLYDPTNASVIGRRVQLQLIKTW